MKHLMHSLFGLLLVAALAGCSSKGGTTDGELAAVTIAAPQPGRAAVDGRGRCGHVPGDVD